uniref:Calmodulin n=1 Tax=Panagrellus redivivus TaxID=6233 RepID=A0A7E4V449_PANRE
MHLAAICVHDARVKWMKKKTVFVKKPDWRQFMKQFDDTQRLRQNGLQNGKLEAIENSNTASSVIPLKVFDKSRKRYNTAFSKNIILPLKNLNNATTYLDKNLKSSNVLKTMFLPPWKRNSLQNRRFRRSYRLTDDGKYDFPRRFPFRRISKPKLEKLATSDTAMASKVTKLITTVLPSSSSPSQLSQWQKTYSRLQRLQSELDTRKTVPGARIFERRMLDIVIDDPEPSLTPSERKSPNGIVHEAMKLVTKLTNKDDNKTENYRVFSPRFMPLMPLNAGKLAPKNMMSPSILAMYDDDSDDRVEKRGDNVASVPNLMKTLGLSETDRSRVMQFIMDATGSTVHVDEALHIYESLGMYDESVSGPLLDASKRIMNSFKTLESSLNPIQKKTVESNGFAFARKAQIQKLAKDQGIDMSEIDLADFDIYDNMSNEEMEAALWHTLELIATNRTEHLENSPKGRQKRDAVSVGAPIVLQPFMFQVQHGLTILGPVILSPNMFCPPILNPSILSPWILSPGMFDPFILSPYIFGPFILGPFLFTPFILTPYFLSPNILNPYVVSSLILSPIGMSPDILSPMVVTASVLSPSFMSPPVLTPTEITGTVLSPSFLS